MIYVLSVAVFFVRVWIKTQHSDIKYGLDQKRQYWWSIYHLMWNFIESLDLNPKLSWLCIPSCKTPHTIKFFEVYSYESFGFRSRISMKFRIRWYIDHQYCLFWSSLYLISLWCVLIQTLTKKQPQIIYKSLIFSFLVWSTWNVAILYLHLESPQNIMQDNINHAYFLFWSGIYLIWLWRVQIQNLLEKRFRSIYKSCIFPFLV